MANSYKGFRLFERGDIVVRVVVVGVEVEVVIVIVVGVDRSKREVRREG